MKHTRFPSTEKLSFKDLISLIEKYNEEKGYWKTEKQKRIRPVPNLSGKPAGSMGTEEVVVDVITEKDIEDKFLLLMLDSLQYQKLTLYVHDSPCCFYPVFGVMYKPSFIHNRKNRYIFKFRECSCSKEIFEKLVKELYSKKNRRKHFSFGLEKIRELSSYEY